MCRNLNEMPLNLPQMNNKKFLHPDQFYEFYVVEICNLVHRTITTKTKQLQSF